MALVSDKYITILDDHYGSLDVDGWITTLKTDFDKYVAGTQPAGYPQYDSYDPSYIATDAEGKLVRPNFVDGTKNVAHSLASSHTGQAWSFADEVIARFELPDDSTRRVGYLTTLANKDTGWLGISAAPNAPSYSTDGIAWLELVITPSASRQIKFRDQVASEATNATSLDTTMAETTYTASLRILSDVYEHKKTAGSNEIVCWFISFKNASYDEVRNAALTAIGEIGNVDGDGYITG